MQDRRTGSGGKNADEEFAENRSEKEMPYAVDFSTRGIDLDSFPFNTWRRLSRNTLVDDNKEMFAVGDPQGEYELRAAIRDYLHSARGVSCRPEQILVGAGSEYLLMLLSQLWGERRELPWKSNLSSGLPGTKEPGTSSCSRKNGPVWHGCFGSGTEQNSGCLCNAVPSVSHRDSHACKRRQELLSWAYRGENRYVIEDDYDSEFRYKGRPIPALQGMDQGGRVIYMGTFSRSIAPAIRVGFMVLPGELLSRYRSQAGFYACTVSRIDQKVLYHFITGGYYERHLNRMRAVYKGKHDVLLSGLKELEDMFWIRGEYAGIHVLLTHKGQMPEKELIERAAGEGVRVYGMSEAVIGENKDLVPSTVILGYANLKEKEIQEGCMRLARAWK